MAGAITGLVGGGTIGGAVVRLVLDSSEFNAGLTSAEGRLKGAAATMQRLGTGMSRVGSSLTRYVTVPLVAAGAVATKMALDFNKAFVLIQTLAGKTGTSIADMKTQVLDLARVTGQDPTGLANALYKVASAGKAAAQNALPILTQAAQGAAIGMGNVNDIAGVLTATTNTYGTKVITAARAMDVLTQAQKDSAAEADALSTSIGPVIGIAGQVGISFQQVAAAMAVATTKGIDTARAATGLRFLIQSLAAPTTAAKTALDRYGISLQDLQRLIANQGLQGTLQTLADTFDLTSTRGQQAWKAVVGGARGAIVANTQVGKSAAVAATEVKRIGDAAGITQKKFELWGHTITGQNAIALGKLKVAAIQLGQKLIPIFESVVNAVTGVVDAFTKLPSGMQGAIVKGLLFAALAGPFLKVAGAITTLIGKFIALTAAEDAAAVSGAAAGAAGAGGAAAGAGAGAAIDVAAGAASIAAGAAAAAAAIGTITVAGATAIPVLGAMATDFVTNATGAQTMKEKVVQLRSELAAGTITQAQYNAALRGVGPQAAAIVRSLDAAANATKGFGVSLGISAGHMGDARGEAFALARANQGIVQSSNQAGGALKGLGGSLGSTAGEANNATGAAIGLTGAINHIPKSHNTKISADAGGALGTIGAVVGALARIPSSVTSTIHVNTVRTSSRTIVQGAGGIIRGAEGFITRGPTYMVGEANYSTFAGRGAEAVTPLDSRGIGILAKALKMAGGGGAGRGINLTINTQGNFNEQTLAASVSRHLARTIREEALV